MKKRHKLSMILCLVVLTFLVLGKTNVLKISKQNFVDVKNFPVSELKKGGYVVFIRHTARGMNEPDNIKLIESDKKYECTHDSSLTQKGRDDAYQIARGIKDNNIPVSEVYSSPTCRTFQMAKILFRDNIQLKRELVYVLVREKEEHEILNQKLLELLTDPIHKKGNRFLIAHGNLLWNWTIGKTIKLEEGEAVVFRPKRQARFNPDLEKYTDVEVLGRIKLKDWLNKS